jgi:hypothetical protein
MFQITGIFFNPPMAIARLGGSGTPLESFSWREDPSLFGAGRTIITPETTLEIQADGSVRPYLPSFIRFRDNFKLRPVAPFFELWVKVRNIKDNTFSEIPLTLALLEQLGGSLEGLTYHITVANRKAERRTGDAACGFVARLDVRGNDHRRRQLLAVSPRAVSGEPLVLDTHPIPLGFIQVIKPIRAVAPKDADAAADSLVVPAVKEMDVDLGVLRVRFTPGKGEVYAPPIATTAPAPGTNRIHEIVKAENRFLNPRSSWNKYDADYSKFYNPEPSDTYDGAGIDYSVPEKNVSWGVVDDTCDGVIEAFLVINGVRFRAIARIFVGPPDFAPDRRHFLSLADDLADRELPPVEIEEETEELTIAEVADIFQRVFETVSLTNLDSLRNYSINRSWEMDGSDERVDGLPLTNKKSMTAKDKPYADKVIIFLEEPDADTPPDTAHNRLPYTNAAQQTHAALADVENLLDFLLTHYKRVKIMIRPPYARVGELSENPEETQPSPLRKRDARVARDNMQDMRMPPYMRSNTASALSLSWRQYDQIMKLLDYLREKRLKQSSPTEGIDLKELLLIKEIKEELLIKEPAEKAFSEESEERPETSQPVEEPPLSPPYLDTPLWQHVKRVVDRRKEKKTEDEKE